jgi:cbb3-type cytochrome oxidase subunit 1
VFLTGMLVMVYNVWKTVRGSEIAEQPVMAPA